MISVCDPVPTEAEAESSPGGFFQVYSYDVKAGKEPEKHSIGLLCVQRACVFVTPKESTHRRSDRVEGLVLKCN